MSRNFDSEIEYHARTDRSEAARKSQTKSAPNQLGDLKKQGDTAAVLLTADSFRACSFRASTVFATSASVVPDFPKRSGEFRRIIPKILLLRSADASCR